MTIENTLDRIATALEALVAKGNTYPEAVPTAPLPTETPATLTPTLTPTTTGGPTPAAFSPFTDISGLVAYAMKKYQEIGAEKGAQIQGILSNLGYSNINDVKPEHFGAFYEAVEALGGSQ